MKNNLNYELDINKKNSLCNRFINIIYKKFLYAIKINSIIINTMISHL